VDVAGREARPGRRDADLRLLEVRILESTALSMARDGDCFAPSTTSREYFLKSTAPLFLRVICCVL
jgi:hypothetical protein